MKKFLFPIIFVLITIIVACCVGFFWAVAPAIFSTIALIVAFGYELEIQFGNGDSERRRYPTEEYQDEKGEE